MRQESSVQSTGHVASVSSRSSSHSVVVCCIVGIDSWGVHPLPERNSADVSWTIALQAFQVGAIARLEDWVPDRQVCRLGVCLVAELLNLQESPRA